MEVQLYKPKRFKNFCKKFHSRAEDTLFSIFQKIPERFIPRALSDWMGRYLNKRLQQLQIEQVRNDWKTLALQEVVNEIRKKQCPTNKP